MTDSPAEPAKAQQSFAELRAELAPDVSELLAVPDYAQGDLELVSMGNYLPLLWPALEELNPKSVCEIGADQLTTTATLADWCRAGGRTLTVVDPSVPASVADDDTVRVARKLSVDYLADAEPADLYLVDGDHNYYTVRRELELIAANVTPSASCLVLLHDVSWPCARRDMYYDADSIPAEQRRSLLPDAALTLFDPPMGHQGLPTDEFALVAPDPEGHHGVRTAIESFLAVSTGWEFATIPSIHGLGILWHPGDADPALRTVFADLASSFAQWEPFLATLELNRLRLLEQRAEDGREWRHVSAAVASAEDELRRASLVWREQQEYIQDLEQQVADGTAAGLEQQQRIAALEQQLSAAEHNSQRQALLWAEQQRVITELTSWTTQQERTIAGLRTVRGWMRSRFRQRR